MMSISGDGERRKRTAVLVVHGIGSQRALETVRGVIRAVWLNPDDKGKRIWTHPERDVADIDLSVMTTNAVSDSKDGRSVDFHELYWAHLMSETKAVAVLLWLYELCRKGPIMKLGINKLWWAAAIFLCLLNLSLAVLTLQAVYLSSRHSAQIMLIAPFLLLFSCLLLGLFFAWWSHASRLSKPLAWSCLGGVVITAIYLAVETRWPGNNQIPDVAELVAAVALPTMLALLATYLVMGRQGVRAFCWALVISLVISLIFIGVDRYWDSTSGADPDGQPRAAFAVTLIKAWPWGLNSPWSVDLAWAIVGLYLAINAAFLQPYLGDAARYFRNSPANVAVRRAIRKEAVDTLHRLHTSGEYDRVVIVAHSLGCVVSYDMLRAYFSRICNELPPVDQLGQDFADIDAATWQPTFKTASIDDKKTLRVKARNTIAYIAEATVGKPVEERKYKSWLVTDFVTLGNALTHAYFLMCLGKTREELKKDFTRRVEEREFPTCPPKRLDGDGLLAFDNPRTNTKNVHHGAVFGLTRWTNIYFPRRQLFWGDAIGGGVSPIFGDHIVDLEVSTRKAGGDDFFTHTTYWDVDRKPDTCDAPHITALREAVDLADVGTAINLVDKGADPTKHEAE